MLAILVLAAVIIAVYVAMTFVDVRTAFARGPKAANVTGIVIHHDANDKPVELYDIDKFHTEARKWSCGFAYHWYLTGGKVYHISDDNQIKAHTLNNNTGNIGICLNGNFDVDSPTLRQQINLILLTNYLVVKYKIKKENIKGHRDYNETSCPGANFDLETFKNYIIDYDRIL